MNKLRLPKSVTMAYQEHIELLEDRKKHKEELKKFGDLLAEQEKLYTELVKERDDIVVIEEKRVMIQKDWKLIGNAISNYQSYEDRYAYFPRFISGDDLAKALDDGYMEMFNAIKDLQAKFNDEESGRKRDKLDFFKMNKTIPINVWGALSERQRERIRKTLHRAELKLRKEEK